MSEGSITLEDMIERAKTKREKIKLTALCVDSLLDKVSEHERALDELGARLLLLQELVIDLEKRKANRERPRKHVH